MPKIISYTPGWLSRPSPGFQLFNTAQSTSSTQQGWRGSSQERNGNLDSNSHTGPNRTIAQRGTEIFLAAGKQIRWTDLVSLKDEYEEQLRTPSRRPKPAPGGNQPGQEDEGPEDLSYRVRSIFLVIIL